MMFTPKLLTSMLFLYTPRSPVSHILAVRAEVLRPGLYGNARAKLRVRRLDAKLTFDCSSQSECVNLGLICPLAEPDHPVATLGWS